MGICWGDIASGMGEVIRNGIVMAYSCWYWLLRPDGNRVLSFSIHWDSLLNSSCSSVVSRMVILASRKEWFLFLKCL